MIYVDEMTHHYAIMALWSSTDTVTGPDGWEDVVSMDERYTVEDIHPDTLAEMRRDCEAFVESARDGEWNGTGTDLLADMDAEQAGHDFWLTRNHHGVGFWDLGLGDRGDQLTAMAGLFGEVDLYIGDDGKVHGA